MDIMQFWELTYGEIIMFVETYNERKRDEAQLQAKLIYQMSSLITTGTNVALNGGDYPSLYETFPGLFEKEAKEAAEQQLWMEEKNKWLVMAEQFNARRKEAQS